MAGTFSEILNIFQKVWGFSIFTNKIVKHNYFKKNIKRKTRKYIIQNERKRKEKNEWKQNENGKARKDKLEKKIKA